MKCNFCKFVAYQRMTLKKFHSASDYLQKNYGQFLFVVETEFATKVDENRK